MDPNRHHGGFIGNTDDRSIPMYYTKTNDDLTHSQIYPKAASMNKKPCMCTSVAGNGMCNMCRNPTSEINWKINQYDPSVEYGSKDGSNCQQESQMYVHAHHHQSYNNKGIDININKPYWTQNKQNHLDEMSLINKKMVPTHLEVVHKPPLGTKNNYSMDNVNFQYEQQQQQHQQQHQQQQQQRHITADIYCKDRCAYEEKYRLKDETCRSSKVDFMPLTNNTLPMYNIGNQNSIKIEAARTNTVDQQVVNPSNTLATKEQQPSPNYARKCPQIFSNVEHNSCHSNLYVSPPQFSSEKFTNISSQQKIFRESSMQEYRTYESTTPQSVHIHPDNMNHRESPMQTSSPIMAYGPSQSNYPTMVNDQPPSRGSQHYSYAANPVRNANYYVPSISKVDTPEMSPIIVKQTHTPHQYSKSILPPPTSHLMPQKPMQRVIEDCVKKEEDPFDMHPSSNRNLYINPFNTGLKTDDCCIKQSTSFTPKPQTICKDEPSNSYLKYNKCSLNSMSSNKPIGEIVNTPQQNHSSAYSRPNYYYENQSLRYENNALHMSSSPAVAATAASPLPATSQTHTPLHHTMYVTQPQQHHMQNMEPYQLQPQQTELERQNSKRHDFRGGGVGGVGGVIDAHEAQPNRARTNIVHKSMQQNLNPQPTPPSQAPQSTKKSQATKPNYRELINHVYAMRNATSEEELNLQIIKKALNVDTQIIRSPVAQVPVQMNVQNDKQPFIAPIQYPPKDGASIRTNIQALSGYSTKYIHKRNLVPDVSQPVPKATDSMLQQIKQEKPSSFSPLDLSMRTIKTKADSTEYSQKSYGASSMNPPNTGCKYTLPRVDFTPNFSLHAKIPGTKSVLANMPPAQADKRQQFMQSTPKVGYDIHNQAVQSSQRPAPPSMVAATNVVRYETQPKVDPFHRVSTCANLIPVAPPTTEPSGAMEMMKNKMLPRAIGPQKVFQTRPSVLEANPYAQPKQQSLKQHKESINTISVVDQLPPDTSIMVLPKANPANAPNLFENQVKPQTAYSLACERNPNFLGRKRHLHEYNTNAKYAEPTLNKQPRFQEPKTIVLADSPGLNQPNDVKIVEKPKVVEIAIRSEVADVKAAPDAADMIVCKQEPSTPTPETASMTPVPIKSETTAIIASRIRTKAELKGFTFNASPKENTCFKEVKIKVEPLTPADPIELPCIPGLVDERSQSNLLDFDWSNACNDFVEQLLTNTKKRTIKKKVQPAPKLEESNEDPSATTVSVRKPDTVIVSNNVQRINEDSQDSRSLSTVDSTAALKTATCRTEANDSAMTLKSISQESAYQPSVIQKKISKVEREKMRSQQEKRIAARLQRESSSESENEVNKRLTERLKKPLKRGKTRGLTADKKRFSDCGSDSSDSDDPDDQDGPPSKSTKQQQNVNDRHQAEQRLSESNNNEQPITNKSNVIIENKRENQNSSKEESNQLKSSLNENEASTAESESEDLATKLVDESQSKQCPHEIHTSKKVQYANVSNKDNNIFSKQIRKPKLHSKMIGLNTMTRSKRKRELEMQLANSKVLRNDKIIRNSTTKIKRKYVKKFSNNLKQSAGIKERKEQEQLMSTRLRSKNEKQLASNHNSLSNAKRVCNKKKHDGPLNKEQQTDLFLEVYRYKRSLKIPASLISIKHPSNQRISSSLPDLEKNLEEPSSSSAIRKPKVVIKKHVLASKKETHSKLTNTPSKIAHSEEPKSIIDLLHSRVINSSGMRPTKVKPMKANTSASSIHTLSETSQTTESNSIGLGELLPTPKKPETIDATTNDGKKRHFSIFDTKVLQTKTRTESKLQQKKEIIREIFVGDDRPASAPPEMTQALDGGEKMTYEQKYEQFLQQMNIVINEEKLLKFGRATTSISTSTALKDKIDPLKLSIKEEEVDEKVESEHLQDNVSTVSGISGTTSCFRRRRPAKYLRRKGSSGFDYIRKKKKPTPPVGANSALLHPIIKTERIDEYEYGKIKTESDVCREIQKWVLNKGVGQSTMHKAARLGYMDVIVYCLDRMGLNPDQKDNAGYTPLHEACTNGWLEIARILLQYGANHSEAAHSGIRPLHEASENDNLEIVRMLLSYGADPLLATYSGQTPLMLASSNSMKELIREHLNDVQALGKHRKPWRFDGPWQIFDETKNGFNIFGGVPTIPCDVSKALRKGNIISNKKLSRNLSGNSTQPITNSCAVLLDNIDHFNSVRLYNETIRTDPKPATSVDQSQFLIENSDSDGEMFEFEEADVLLPPLYLLKDEGMDKWVLLSDLCNLLKVKSKDTLLNKIYPSSSISSAHKSLMRELKMSDFLEKATCLQLLCAGEKINICASKVVLIKYNDNVRNLLGVKTILMKF